MRILQDIALTVEVEIPDNERFRDDATDLIVRSALDLGFGGEWLRQSLTLGEFSIVEASDE